MVALVELRSSAPLSSALRDHFPVGEEPGRLAPATGWTGLNLSGSWDIGFGIIKSGQEWIGSDMQLLLLLACFASPSTALLQFPLPCPVGTSATASRRKIWDMCHASRCNGRNQVTILPTPTLAENTWALYDSELLGGYLLICSTICACAFALGGKS